MGASAKVEGPDLSAGVVLATIAEGATIAGHVGEEAVLLSRRGGDFFAVSGSCTHYGAPLAHGLVNGDRVHCPWHHACFSLRTGQALTPPAFDALKRWRVQVDGGHVFVREAIDDLPPKPTPPQHVARCIAIVGGGAAGFAAADMLRRQGFDGEITLLSGDTDPPCDRPNLSKEYLTGEAPREWLPLKPAEFYRDNGIDIRLQTTIAQIKPTERRIVSATGDVIAYDVLLLATGASPIRLKGFDHAKVHLLRTVRDAEALIAAAAHARRVVIIGAGFIGLETAASLRTRGLQIDVITPDAAPLVRTLGDEVARLVRSVHEEHGVRFHFNQTAAGYDGKHVHLKGGKTLGADLVVLGVGVRPNTELAANAGLSVSDGIEVDEFLRTSDPAIFAAGDVASFLDDLNGIRARIEHWAVAERQGQVAAVNMLGSAERYEATPFFWSAHYGQSLRYVGHAPKWDKVAIDGSVAARDFTARYSREGRLLAAATLNRDHENLELEQILDRARREARAQAAH
jgi:NADPH-dependent 2,4-dienoyl-CoA reductase/sulfur reductase-like enzyme/nitrite reductase/ring-hydroxylating ferredoxin subunit